MIPRIVPPSVLPSAIGLQNASFNGASFVGPPVGGLLYVLFCMTGLLAVNALCFAAIIPPLLALRAIPPLAAPGLSLLSSVIDGARYTKQRPIIVWILSVSATVFVAAGPANALLPAFAGERLVGGMSWLSLLLATMGLGSVTGAFVTMNMRRFRSPGTVFLLSAAVRGCPRLSAAVRGCPRLSAAVRGLAITLFAISVEPGSALFFLFLHGLAGAAVTGIAHSMLQATTADAYRGRVMSVWGFQFVGLQPVGQFGLGILGSLLGIQAALVVAGVVALAAGAYGAARLPVLRDWRPPAADLGSEITGSRGIGAAN